MRKRIICRFRADFTFDEFSLSIHLELTSQVTMKSDFICMRLIRKIGYHTYIDDYLIQILNQKEKIRKRSETMWI